MSEGRRRLHAGTRSCVGCGARVAADRLRAELVRLVFVYEDDGTCRVVADLAGRSGGRGAWVHARLDCLAAAARKGLSRAAKAAVTVDVESLAAQLRAQADHRIVGLLGAAKRARKLAIGADAVREAAAGAPLPTILVASDAAASLRLTEVRRAQADGRAVAWGDKERLGNALGRGEVGVLAVCDAGIAAALRQAIGLAETFGSVSERSPGTQGAN